MANETLARRYATAVFQLADEAGAVRHRGIDGLAGGKAANLDADAHATDSATPSSRAISSAAARGSSAFSNDIQ